MFQGLLELLLALVFVPGLWSGFWAILSQIGANGGVAG